ncbi:mechanosensitive channel MscK [Stutzerimonas kirkiae]|uniref:Mechanosensitive channel MscK n=1 Tax=Stutzerimonas kirkiae TaxID=2211392 RepID=A0A4Q9QY41_9GAMM|nr:mechanosensitive channel MscK [Stutzerimonas kirkiae]TBU89783.1 mechanosensitive channel MscK [Stutzerimonas kirkiae]TBU99619.1 mechanosensitive channel MscK [Stutzerimonas kirkiae]TBV12094.1 mechanosensitive channel MscK [Stutzerimonas kirkiae]TBV14896.1 mechanosensitive channel MscK [Stutzerimonas kirkiae]
MTSIRTLSFLLLLTLSLAAATQAAPPGLGALTGGTAAASGASTTESESKAAAPSLKEQAQQLLEQKQATQRSLADLKQQLNEAPEEIRRNQAELARLRANALPAPTATYSRQAIPELERTLAERIEQLAEWQRAFTVANSLIITSQTRPERVQTEIGNSQARQQRIAAQLKSGRESASKPLTDESRKLLEAEQEALEALIELRRQELAGNNLLQDLGKSRRDLLGERIARADQETLALQTLINDKRRAASEQTVAELSARAEAAGTDSLLASESAANLKLSDYLLRTTERLNQLTQQNLQTRQQLDAVNQSDQALEEQISVLQGSLLLSRVLYQQKQALPRLHLDKNLADEIADIRLYQFELNQARNRNADPAAYVEQLLASQDKEQPTDELRKALLELVTTRSELLDRLNRGLSELLNESITLQLNQKQLQSKARSLSETLDEQMFWIPSNKPLDFAWLANVPQLLERQLAAMPWTSALSGLWAGLLERPLFFLPLLLAIGVLLWRRPSINRKLVALSRDIGHFRNDSQLHTPLAMLLNLLLAMPGALFLALCGYLLQSDGRAQNVALGAALYQMAQAWLVFYAAYRMLSPGRVAELHFRWSVPQVAFLRDEVRRLGLVVLTLVVAVSIAESQPAGLADDVLGIGVILTCYALMSWRLTRVLLKGPASENAPPLRLLFGLLFSTLPLALILVVGLGYYYTALKLTERLIDTLYLLMLWVALEATLVRALTVAARRLAYQRYLAKRQAAEEAGGEALEHQEEPGLDIEQVNQQSLRLTRLAIFGAFLVALYWVWSDLISVVSYLDNVTLYEFTSGSGENAVNKPISLNDLLGALLIIGITMILARNLPGLLEVLVLSRLQLAQGSAYATGALLSYTLVGVGIVSTLSTLGVSWDKLQWLVAALSVGLGFGLQEIFANFISGLIILFEKPVRIGDVVTIGNLSGTVSRIRIRATTITDFDHKEIIVPNKTFVTDQLLNWSLSDTVTRVTIRIGVEFGSDLERVRQILLEAAEGNARVLHEPEPQVFFLSFGDSRLEHELRLHVKGLADRNPVIDEINRQVDREFHAAGIKVAFRQLDVHLKSRQGQELLIEQGTATGDAARSDG